MENSRWKDFLSENARLPSLSVIRLEKHLSFTHNQGEAPAEIEHFDHYSSK